MLVPESTRGSVTVPALSEPSDTDQHVIHGAADRAADVWKPGRRKESFLSVSE